MQCQCHVFATLITFTNPLTDCQQERNMLVFTKKKKKRKHDLGSGKRQSERKKEEAA